MPEEIRQSQFVIVDLNQLTPELQEKIQNQPHTAIDANAGNDIKELQLESYYKKLHKGTSSSYERVTLLAKSIIAGTLDGTTAFGIGSLALLNLCYLSRCDDRWIFPLFGVPALYGLVSSVKNYQLLIKEKQAGTNTNDAPPLPNISLMGKVGSTLGIGIKYGFITLGLGAGFAMTLPTSHQKDFFSSLLIVSAVSGIYGAVDKGLSFLSVEPQKAAVDSKMDSKKGKDLYPVDANAASIQRSYGLMGIAKSINKGIIKSISAIWNTAIGESAIGAGIVEGASLFGLGIGAIIGPHLIVFNTPGAEVSSREISLKLLMGGLSLFAGIRAAVRKFNESPVRIDAESPAEKYSTLFNVSKSIGKGIKYGTVAFILGHAVYIAYRSTKGYPPPNLRTIQTVMPQLLTGSALAGSAKMVHSLYNIYAPKWNQRWKALSKMQKGWVISSGLAALSGLGLLIAHARNSYIPPDAFQYDLKANGKPLPLSIKNFLNNHIDEIEFLYNREWSMGNWKQIGEGGGKRTYTHPDLPGYVVKIPKYILDTNPRASVDLREHFKNLPKARQLLKTYRYDKLVIPSSYLIETAETPIAIEQKLKFSPHYTPDEDKQTTAEKQLKDFLNRGRFCDIYIEKQHNAGFLAGTEKNPKIGIFDLDCNIDDMNARRAGIRVTNF